MFLYILVLYFVKTFDNDLYITKQQCLQPDLIRKTRIKFNFVIK